MHVSDFDYDLPEHFIAQTPLEPRDSSKLMVLKRTDNSITHRIFRDVVEYFRAGDVLVMNNTRVIPARIAGFRADTGGKLEVLLLRQLDDTAWRVLIGGKQAKIGTKIGFPNATITAEVLEVTQDEAERVIRFSQPVNELLIELGETPLPPYIHMRVDDAERYQTIYSRYDGSSAAPTAGLHFTPDVMLALREKGVLFAYCTLHIGLDTFQPVKVDVVTDHKIHSEEAILTTENAEIINKAKLAGGRIIAVGTTTARTLETAGILSAGGDPSDPSALGDICAWRPVTAFQQDTRLFIYPSYKWRVVDAMITNFHLPKSSLLMMISSFAGREFMLDAYETAKREAYRFFSFGDAMLIL
jgi:S-adenosylmethionine:tRNA ribosyltransferase-isomerase